MISHYGIFIFGLCEMFSAATGLLYLYDRCTNRAVRYDFTDIGNVYYASRDFHSVDFFKRNHNASNASNASKSLPDIKK